MKRFLSGAAVAVAASVLVACGSNDAPEAGDEPTTQRTGADRISLSLSGGVEGTAESAEPGLCSWNPSYEVPGKHDYQVQFLVTVDDTSFEFSVRHSAVEAGATATYSVQDPETVVDLVGPRPLAFGNLDPESASGTITIDANLAGKIEATLGPDAAAGRAPRPVTVRGEWDCAEFVTDAT